MGLYEYLLWIEQLVDAYGQPTRSIWVLNNGIAHTDSIPNSDIAGWVQDGLDSIEYITGPADSTWGSKRAAAGHPEPFPLAYVAIGNEDCGKPWYTENYLSFYNAISAAYPNITLISNCDPTQFDAPVQLWDYHIYEDADHFIAGQTFFDNYDRDIYAKIFVSEYGTHGQEGKGNLYAALATAAYMIGMERNGDLVTTAAYAPLINNADLIPDYKWDAIDFNYEAAYMTPVYYNQIMFSLSNQELLPNTVETLSYSLSDTFNVSVSVTQGILNPIWGKRHDGANTVYIFKIVNYNMAALNLNISLVNMPANSKIITTADLTCLSSVSPWDENSFENPTAISPISSEISISSPVFMNTFKAYSINVLRVYAAIY